MQFDEVLKYVGEFGRYQKTKYFLLCLMAITNAFQALVSVFSMYTPKHRCSLPLDIFNGTDLYVSDEAGHSKLIDMYIPRLEDGSYDSCKIYTTPALNMNDTATLNATQCDSWVYDRTEMESSIVMQWNLVCDANLKATLSTSMFMFGNLVGSAYSGVLSDWMGRRKTLLISVVGHILSGTVMAFAPEFYSFTVCRFFMGCFNMQMFLTAFVMGMEMIGPDYRLITGVVIEIFWAIGFLILIGLAYFIRWWSYLQLAITIPSLFFISYYWLMPESARWLMAKGRVSEAEEVVLIVAKTNGKTIPSGLLQRLEEPKKPEKIKQILKAPRLLCRTIIIFFNWFAVSMSYYGLSLNSGNMPGSLHVNMTLSAVAEVVGYLLCFLCFKLGRKGIHVSAMIIGGLGLFGSIPILYLLKDATQDERNNYFLALNTIGKLGVTMGFAVIYFWCAEIFPTLIRNSLMGASSMFARVGSIFAPVIADIGKLVPPQHSQMLPPLIFGIVTFSAGLASIGLPETTGETLPETIREANVFPGKLEEEVSDDKGIKEKEDDPMFGDDRL